MKKSIHSESEMVKAVKELERQGVAVIIKKCSGMDVNQVRRLKELEEENRKLKQMYADLALDNRILRDVIKKNSRARDKEIDSSRAC